MVNLVRKNVASLDEAERNNFRDAVLELNRMNYPDGVSFWFKQDQIHQATHVHGGPAFLPWHRELCNRFEALLRQVNPTVSLHYWDWQTDPRNSPDGQGGTVNLFTTGATGFMGSSINRAGSPLDTFDNNGVANGSRDLTGNPADPPSLLERYLDSGRPPINSDENILIIGDDGPEQDQYSRMRNRFTGLEQAHNVVHGYFGVESNIGKSHRSFEDPFVYLLHSNVDRLWASWQLKTGKEWRLDPDRVYGSEGNDFRILENMKPWSGDVAPQVRPWAPPENEQFLKNSKDPSIVKPPLYDKYI